MGILDYFKKIIKKDTPIGLVDMSNIFPIPKRDSLVDTALLDQIKEKYEELLKNRINLSRELDIEKIHDEVVMYTELVLNNLDYVSDKEKSIKKLEIYQEKIKEIYNTLVVRLVALDEIRNEKIILSRRKRDIIVNAISTIQISLVNIRNLLGTLDREIKALSNNELWNYIEEKNEGMNIDRNKYIQELCDNNIANYETLAMKEIYLEKYIYHHKKEVNWLKKEMELVKDSDKYDDKFENIEKRYLLFYLFGRNLINDDEMYKLYQKKLTMIVNDNTKDMAYYINRMFIVERKMYEKVIMSKINDLQYGNNAFLREYKNRVSVIKYIRLINFINEYLKRENGTYDLWNEYNIRMLFSLDKENGLVDYFDNVKYLSEIKDIVINITGILIDKKVPLKSFLTMVNRGLIEVPYERDEKEFNLLGQIYALITNDGKENYVIPEGIVSIDDCHIGFISKEQRMPIKINSYQSTISLYNVRTKNMNIIMPKTLEKFNVRLSTGIDLESTRDKKPLFISKVVFQEGTKEIKLIFDAPLNIWTIEIPSSVCNFSINTFSNELSGRTTIRRGLYTFIALILDNYEESSLFRQIINYQEYGYKNYPESLIKFAKMIYDPFESVDFHMIGNIILRDKKGNDICIPIADIINRVFHECSKNDRYQDRYQIFYKFIELLGETVREKTVDRNKVLIKKKKKQYEKGV